MGPTAMDPGSVITSGTAAMRLVPATSTIIVKIATGIMTVIGRTGRAVVVTAARSGAIAAAPSADVAPACSIRARCASSSSG